METARIIQVSDTHLAAAQGVPAAWTALVRAVRADPPDLVVHSGDIVREDPDDAEDRAFARRLVDELPGDVVAIPGNHDVGFYGEPAEVLARRSATFRAGGGELGGILATTRSGRDLRQHLSRFPPSSRWRPSPGPRADRTTHTDPRRTT